MIIDLGPIAGKNNVENVCSAHGVSRARRRMASITSPRFRVFLVVWTVVSIAWVVGAVNNIYQRVNEQAAMSMDVERDLDQGLTSAACARDCAGTIQPAAASNRFDIASTYFRFGSMEMGEWVFGPPIALLLIGLGALSVSVRRGRRGF